MTENTPSPLGNVISIDDERIKNHLDRVVRGTVEETLNALLDAEADRLCNAQRYERSEARRDTRAGHYERSLQTKAGEVRLRVPKLRTQTFETAVIERYRGRERSVDDALIEMYLAGLSVRRVEDITEALWGTRVSPSTVSELNKKIYGTIEAWRNRPIEGEHPYVYLDGIVLKRSWAGEVRNVSLLVAIGVNASGYREILGICGGAKEDPNSRRRPSRRRSVTTLSRKSTGAAFAPTIRSNASCARSGGAPASWVRSPTVSRRSTLPRPGCGTSRAPRGRPRST